MRRAVLFLFAGLCLTFSPILSTSAHASNDRVRTRLGDLAKRFLESTKESKIRIGAFTVTGQADANGGPGIAETLRSELIRQKADVVERGARYEIAGSYGHFFKDEAKEFRIIKLRFRLTDLDSGEDIDTGKLTLEGTDTIASLLGVTGSVPDVDPRTDVPRSGKQRKQDVDDLNKDPTTHIFGDKQSKVSAFKDSDYGVEILTGKPFQAGELIFAEPLTLKNGHAFADIAQGDIYAVRIHNGSTDSIAVRLSIDGLDVFHFSADKQPDGTPKYTHHIIKPGGTLTIPGWFNALKKSPSYRAFLITEYGAGAVSEANAARGSVGQIHLQFAKCRTLGPNQKARGGKETGFGPDIERKLEEVKTEIDVPHEFLTIRYDRPE